MRGNYHAKTCIFDYEDVRNMVWRKIEKKNNNKKIQKYLWYPGKNLKNKVFVRELNVSKPEVFIKDFLC